MQRHYHVWLFATPCAIVRQAPLSMGFSRQEYWSGLPCPRPGDLPDPGIKPRSYTLQADSLSIQPAGKPLENATRYWIWLSTSELWARTCQTPASPPWAGERPESDRPGPAASLPAQQTHWIQAPTRLPMQMSLWVEMLSVAVLCSVRITKNTDSSNKCTF